jgi:hypothetical protein
MMSGQIHAKYVLNEYHTILSVHGLHYLIFCHVEFDIFPLKMMDGYVQLVRRKIPENTIQESNLAG